MTQIEWVYIQLQSLKTETLIQLIDELECEFPKGKYRDMATDVYKKAKEGMELTDKQKRVLVNIIGQPNSF